MKGENIYKKISNERTKEDIYVNNLAETETLYGLEQRGGEKRNHKINDKDEEIRQKAKERIRRDN